MDLLHKNLEEDEDAMKKLGKTFWKVLVEQTSRQIDLAARLIFFEGFSNKYRKY
jgi:hypothetical protein